MSLKTRLIAKAIAGVLVAAAAFWIVWKDFTIAHNWQEGQFKLWTSYNEAGDALLIRGRLDEALNARRYSLVIAEHLVDADPGNGRWQGDAAVSNVKISEALLAQGRSD